MDEIDQAVGPCVRVPAPGPDARPVQLLDVRDAALFAVGCAQDGLEGDWNVAGRPMASADILDAIRAATATAAEVVRMDEAAVVAVGVAPWTEMPLMAPPGAGFHFFGEVGAARAREAGLAARPLAETPARLVAWDRGRRDVPLGCGMSTAREGALLARAPGAPGGPA